MKVHELIKALADCDGDKEILAEVKITGEKIPFEESMGFYDNDGTIVFYQK